MKKLLCLLGGAMLVIQANAQKIEPLSIGDTVPDIVFDQVMNSTDTNFKLSDFRGKLVILDFFGTWCGACVGSIPKMDSLQKQMGDKLQVIVICEDFSNEVVTDYIKKKWNGQAEKITLPFVLYDSTTISLFPHRMIPHEVWISPEGVLIATTGSKEVTLTHLKKAIKNPDIKLKQKVDLMKFDREMPLFVDGNGGGMKPLITKSILSNEIYGIGSSAGIVIDSVNHLKRLYFINTTIITLFQYIYNYPRNRIMFNLGDSIKFIKEINKGFFSDQLYCYELTIPDTASIETISRVMYNDLMLNLHMSTHIEHRMMNCYILKRINNGSLTPLTGIGTQLGSMNILVSKLESQGFFPVIDKTNYNGDINHDIANDCFKHPQKLNKALKARGLELAPSRQRINILVISNN